MMMDDDKIKALRERHVQYAQDLAKAEDAKQRSDMQVSAEPGNPLVWLGAWLIDIAHSMLVKDEAQARAAARKTYDHN
jgi:hypothetical protein